MGGAGHKETWLPGSALWLAGQSLPRERAPEKQQSPQSDPLQAQRTGQHPAQPPAAGLKAPFPGEGNPQAIPRHPACTMTAISLLFKEL